MSPRLDLKVADTDDEGWVFCEMAGTVAGQFG